MANTANYEVEFEFTSGGAAKVQSDLDKLNDTVDELTRSGDVSEKGQEKLTKSIQAMGREVRASGEEVKKTTGSLNAQRYALYEMATAYGAVSAAIIGTGVALSRSFAEMESGFTKVERTTGLYGDALAPVTADILQLSREIPTLTSEIQSLAARGAQMGIAAEDVADFAEVMAKFVATSPEVDVNSVAEAFGRLSNLTGTDDFEALASSIAQVGVNSAATDAQIIKTTQELARATNATSLTASEVIGLAAAMASLGVAPEAARGIMNQFFAQLEKGAAGLNDSLSVAARTMGLTEEAARNLFKEDAGTFFTQFVDGLAGAESAVLVLNEMGLQGQRLIPAFNALTADAKRNADGQTVLANALRDANQGFAERTELDRQFAPIADDLNSKLTLMQNAFMELAYAAGLELAPTMKGLLDILIEVVQGVTDFISSPVGGFLTRLAAGITTVIAAYAGLRSAIALSHALLIAFNTAAGAGAATGLAGSLKGLITMFTGTGVAASGASVGVNRLTIALRALLRATIIGAVLQYVVEWLFNTSGAAESTGNVFIWLADVITDVARAIGSIFGEVGANLSEMAATIGTSGLRQIGNSLSEWGRNLKTQTDIGDDFASQLENLTSGFEDLGDATYDAGAGMGNFGDASASAAKEVRTLLDYASDLSQVWSRAFDIRFSGQQTLDTVTSQFIRIREENERAAKAIRDLRNDIRSLNSDISIQEYYLSIAVEYGDTARAEAIEAELAKQRANLADKTTELQKEQDKANKSLVGNSQSAIDNRKTILDLVKGYQDHIGALAASGMSQADLERETARLKTQFMQQATQLGYNQAELGKYAKAFDDVTVAIRNVPRNVTVTANANPALQALNELNAKIKQATNNGKGYNIPINTAIDTGSAARAARLAELQAQLANAQNQLNRAISSGADNRATSWLNEVTRLKNLINSGSYATGGYTGSGGKYEPAGIVHRGEYVIPKRDVNQSTGMPYADALGRLMNGTRGYANGGYVQSAPVSSSAAVVHLSPASLQHLAQIIPRYLVADGQAIGEVSSNAYAHANAVGAD